MGKRIFVSYKYLDSNVQPLKDIEETTARHYVDKIAAILGEDDHIYKGEDDGEDMGSLADSTIGSKLGNKIFDSSITIVLISKEMRESERPESDQWIPWEISYSLKEQTRDGRNSKTNTVLAVVLPDLFGSYRYFIEDDTCQNCHCRKLNTNSLFQILRDNMFNIKKPEHSDCNNHLGNKPYIGSPSYIPSVKWSDFIADINKYIDNATEIRQNINDYNLTKIVK